MQFVARISAVDYINDSKATNVGAAVAALAPDLIDKPLSWLKIALAAGICDGLGTTRTILHLMPPQRASDGGSVTLRLAEAADEQLMLDWQMHPSTRQYARESRVPTREEHHRWFQARVRSENCFLTVIELEGEPVGVLRLDRVHAHHTATATRAMRNASLPLALPMLFCLISLVGLPPFAVQRLGADRDRQQPGYRWRTTKIRDQSNFVADG